MGKKIRQKTNKINSLSRQEEDMLWECGQLGDKTPKSTISTLWWQLIQRSRLWERQEQHSMRNEDFSFRKDEIGASYIVFLEGNNKNKTKQPMSATVKKNV